MSMTTSVLLLANTSTEPLVPAATMAAFPTTCPCNAFNVEARGRGCPVGYIVRNPRGAGGTAVTFKEYAWASAGMEHVVLDRMGKVRAPPPVRRGVPRPAAYPELDRVSATRHGVMATNT